MIKKIALGVISSIICLNAGWLDNDSEAINKLSQRLMILEKSTSENNKAVEFIIEDHKTQTQSFKDNDSKNKQIQDQFATMQNELKTLKKNNELLENRVDDLKLKLETDIKVTASTTSDNNVVSATVEDGVKLEKIEIPKNTRIRKIASFGLSNVAFVSRTKLDAFVLKVENGFYKTRYGWVSEKVAKKSEAK